MRKVGNGTLQRYVLHAIAVLLTCLVCGGAQAGIALIAPHDNAVVPALPAAQRAVLSKATQEARRTDWTRISCWRGSFRSLSWMPTRRLSS